MTEIDKPYFITNTFALVEDLLLRGKLVLKEISFCIRTKESVYVAAMRVSRTKADCFFADLELIIHDIERLSDDFCGNYSKPVKQSLIRFVREYFEGFNDFQGTAVLWTVMRPKRCTKL